MIFWDVGSSNIGGLREVGNYQLNNQVGNQYFWDDNFHRETPYWWKTSVKPTSFFCCGIFNLYALLTILQIIFYSPEFFMLRDLLSFSLAKYFASTYVTDLIFQGLLWPSHTKSRKFHITSVYASQRAYLLAILSFFSIFFFLSYCCCT